MQKLDQQEAARVLEVLQAVKDPEIPVVSLVELGVVDEISIGDGGQVQVQLIPTFAGCPAIQFMQMEAEAVLHQAGYTDAVVSINRTKPWTSNRITARGRQLIKDFGLSPPPEYKGDLTQELLEQAECPRCGSRDTTLQNPFGPTLCRAIHHCHACHETFEQFKPL